MYIRNNVHLIYMGKFYFEDEQNKINLKGKFNEVCLLIGPWRTS
jgi:hypothetical protein